MPEEYNPTPAIYGGITLEENELSVLSLSPKYAIYQKVDVEQCQAEIEKALAKLRWEEKKELDPNGDELPQEERSWHNHRTKTIDMREFRSTNLPFNSRIFAPKPLDNKTETCMQNLN